MALIEGKTKVCAYIRMYFVFVNTYVCTCVFVPSMYVYLHTNVHLYAHVQCSPQK